MKEKLQVVMLGGGLGTRLRPITGTMPKMMVPVAGRPFVHWQLDLLADNGMEEIVMCVGPMGEQVERSVGDDYRGMGVRYSYDPPGHPLGTAGAIKGAQELLAPAFGVLYGDSYLRVDYRAVMEAHAGSGLPATMTVWKNEGMYDRSNVALMEGGGRVARYEKGDSPGALMYIDHGFLLFDREIISSRLRPGERAELDGLQRDLAAEGLMGAYEVHERFYEIGSPDSLAELERHLGQGGRGDRAV